MANRLSVLIVAMLLFAGAASCSSSTAAPSPLSATMSCSEYSGLTSGDGYIKQTDAVFDMLRVHGIDPAAPHHYVASAGSTTMNITVASEQINTYCPTHPQSAISDGVNWTDFKSA